MSAYNNPAITSEPSLPEYDGSTPASWGQPSASFAPVEQAGAIPPDMDAWSKFGHAFGAAYTSTTYDGLSNSQDLATQEAVDRRNKAVKAATGQDLENPFADGYLDEAMRRYQNEGGFRYGGGSSVDLAYNAGRLPLEERMRVRELQLDAYQSHLDQLARDYPAADIGGDVRSAAKTIAGNAVADAQKAAADAGPIGGFFANLGGGLAAGWRDPLQVSSLFIGAGETAARSVAGQMFETFARHAAVNAAVTGASEPDIAAWRKARGEPTTANDALYDIGLSALFGGALGTVGHLIGGAAHGDASAASQLADRLREENAPQAAAEVAPALRAVEDDNAAAQGAPKDTPPDAAAQMMRDAARGMENPDAPLATSDPRELAAPDRLAASADARAGAVPEATSRLLGEPEPPPGRTLDTVRDIEPPPPPKPIEPGAEGGAPKAAAEADLFPPHELRAAELPSDDILNKTMVERDGKLAALAPDEIAKPAERVGFMAQLIENCVL